MSKTILIVTDEETFGNHLSYLFGLNGHNVTTRSTIGTAISWLGENLVDLIAFDFKLPSHDGNKFITELESRNITAPLMLITDTPWEINSDANFAAVLEKPFRLDTFTTILHTLLPSSVRC